MHRLGRILVVDDLEKWRNVLSNSLQRSGFHVDTAATTAQALEMLTETFYHLAVFDIRLDDPDRTNIEGMKLLRELDERGLSAAIEIIMLSAYGTKEQMRAAYGKYKVADFLSKDDFDNRVFRNQVKQIFIDNIRINLGLTINWQHGSGPEQICLNLEIDGARVKRDTPLQARVAAELEDLLCRLFYEAEKIFVRPLIPGHSGAGVVWVQPFYTAGAGQPVIVKFGDFRKIDAEFRNFKRYIKQFIGGGHSTTVHDLRRTPLLGGIVYSLLGTNDEIEDFGSFYFRTSIPEIKKVLDRLFFNTCGAWYSNPGMLEFRDLSEEYQKLLGFTPENLENALSERLKSIQGKQRLQFKSLTGDRSFANPILKMKDKHLERPTYVCITHGDFNESNILIDKTGQAWLIDFLRTGPGHILRDVAELDCLVRLQLLAPEEASLDERLAMEETLFSIKRFSQVEQLTTRFPTENPALAKSYAISVHLRSLARRLVLQNPSDDISEYYIALLYYTISKIRLYWLPKEQREHAMLSASLLAEQLGL